MGYRTYIGFLSKEEYNKIKGFNQEQLCTYKGEEDKECYVGAYDIAKELYEFGKYTEFDDAKFFTPFWDNKEFQKSHEGDFWVVEKDFLKHIIEHYKNKIIDFYDKLLSTKNVIFEKHKDDKDITEQEINNLSFEKKVEWFSHIRDMRMEWTHNFAFDLSDNEKITSSWKYEYSIFELVKIYKTFDWKNNVMVYYGY